MSRREFGRAPGLALAVVCALAPQASRAQEAAPVVATAIRGNVEVMFPMAPPGRPQPKAESGWRISYLVHPLNNSYGGSRVWQITDVSFMRGYKDSAGTEPDWIRVLDDLVLTDMHVPYNDGETEYWDVSQQTFGFVKGEPGYLPEIGCYACAIEADGFVAREVVDDGIRWTSTVGGNFEPDGGDLFGEKARRGQVLWLWTTLAAGNYRYIVKYGFTDDGTIRARVGGTAHNYHALPVVHDNPATHLHTGYWRMQFNLGAPEKNHIHVVERITTPAESPAKPTKSGAKSLHRDFSHGREGGESWDPIKFTAIKIESMVTKNRHDPPLPVAYKLMPMGSGTGRMPHPYTQRDFWITRVAPDRRPKGYEARYIDVPKNIALSRPRDLPTRLSRERYIGETTHGKAVVLWHQAGLQHIPRTEDFGATGYEPYAGTALIHWAGFDLMPHNLWDKTPLYNLPPPDIGEEEK